MSKKISKCLRCGKEFESRGSGKLKKKYCSKLCGSRQYAIDYYQKVKDTKEYKQKRKVYFRKWLDKNRKHFNDSVRDISRINMRKQYNYRRANHLCVYCGSPNTKGCSCDKCKIKRKNSKKQHE